ncbi:MAG: histidine kinase [Hespellia sp.]|nr:histidine kinase [Hespellia sp.]
MELLNSEQKRILESEDILEYIFTPKEELTFQDEKEFYQNLYNIVGYDYSFFHMNIINLESNTLTTFGREYLTHPYEPETSEQKQIIKDVLALDGSRLIQPSTSGSLYSADPDTETISLLRAFGRYPLTTSKAIIEIQIDVNSIGSLIADTLTAFGSEKGELLILDDQQNIIYPTNLSDEAVRHYTSIHTDKQLIFRNPITNKDEIITSYTSSDYKFRTLLLTPTSYIDGNRTFFLKVSLLIAITMLLLLAVISFQVAKSISSPISKLRDSISNLQLDSIPSNPEFLPNSNLNELEMLSKAYGQMQIRLKESLDTIVQSRTLSIHSQIMALQAQMDSHFLYNTLTIISIMAEEHDDMPVSEMCIKLTQMLRYITEDYSKQTTFESELRHTQNYTDLMHIRFGSEIAFYYDMDDSLNQIQIPRLVLQPFVENCVKYSRKANQRLEVHINSYKENGYWITSVRDNGEGFSSEALNSFHENIEALNAEINYPQLSINGMGLANIYLRLKLFYADDFIFDIKNDTVGSIIKIGGKLDEF